MIRRVTYPGPGETDISRLGRFVEGQPRDVELSLEQAESLARKGWKVEGISRSKRSAAGDTGDKE